MVRADSWHAAAGDESGARRAKCRTLTGPVATAVRHAARYVVLHREWSREFCRVLRYCTGVDGTRGHEHRAYRLVSGTGGDETGVGESTVRGLITRRSEVQILPPPPSQMQ